MKKAEHEERDNVTQRRLFPGQEQQEKEEENEEKSGDDNIMRLVEKQRLKEQKQMKAAQLKMKRCSRNSEPCISRSFLLTHPCKVAM